MPRAHQVGGRPQVKRLLLLATLLFALPARAQVVELTGGTSTEYHATGGAVSLYTPGLATRFDIGIANGHLMTGASSNFEFRGWNVHAGDEPANLLAGDLSLSVPVRGVVASKRRGESVVTVFTGLVGTS